MDRRGLSITCTDIGPQEGEINKITVSISTHSGFHRGCSFQLHDLCVESHTAGRQVAVGGGGGSQKVSGEESRETERHYLSIPTGLKYSETSYLFCIRGANKKVFIDWQWPMFVFVCIDNIDDTRRRKAIV